MEYEEAKKNNIPIFILIEEAVYAEHHVYLKNKENSEIDGSKIFYPSVDSTKIFDFIDEVRKSSYNNAVYSFKDFSDMEIYLRQQWAGMMFSFLTHENEGKRVSDTLNLLTDMNARIEIISKQILNSVGTEAARLDVDLYELMLDSETVRDLTYWHVKPTPMSIFTNRSFKECAKSLNIDFKIEDDDEDISIGSNKSISLGKFNVTSQDYEELRNKMIKFLKSKNITPEQYIEQRKR